jgi:regulator of cell morphogenesis and NO signaling
MTDLQTSLGDIVAANPAAARVLEGLGLDYCCHGDRSLEAACAAAGLDAEHVTAELAGVDDDVDVNWTALDPPALAAHIVDTHHAYLHTELPQVHALAGKVLAVHGDRHPELVEVTRLVTELCADLEPHLLKEERVLFPAIRELAAGRADFAFGSVANPIRMMNLEHDRCAELLEALRLETAGYTVPDDACASYRSLYQRLEALEFDTHVHIHKENHVLFPAAIALTDR